VRRRREADCVVDLFVARFELELFAADLRAGVFVGAGESFAPGLSLDCFSGLEDGTAAASCAESKGSDVMLREVQSPATARTHHHLRPNRYTFLVLSRGDANARTRHVRKSFSFLDARAASPASLWTSFQVPLWHLSG
jgi:hypothetical protein